MLRSRGPVSGAFSYEEFTAAVRAALAPPRPVNESDRGEPQVTVAMPAYNAAPYIGAAIASVVNQTGVRLELIVVDDGSTDGTANVVELVRDTRVRLLRNSTRRGIGHSHNRVVSESRAPIIVHVDADDFILPGALARAVAALNGAPAAGQVFADHIELDGQSKISKSEFERQRDFLLRRRSQSSDLRRDLLVHGMVANPLRTYRASALAAVGPFNERLKYAIDYDMTVRIADRFEVQPIPEILYCQRIHASNTQQHLRLRSLRSWWTRLGIARELLRHQPTLLGRTRVQVYTLALTGLAATLRLDAALKRVARQFAG